MWHIYVSGAALGNKEVVVRRADLAAVSQNSWPIGRRQTKAHKEINTRRQNSENGYKFDEQDVVL